MPHQRNVVVLNPCAPLCASPTLAPSLNLRPQPMPLHRSRRFAHFRFFLRRRRWRKGGASPAFILKPQPPNHHQCLPNNMARHFRMALEPISKNDRDFHYFHPLTPQAMRHFDLETISVRAHLLQMNCLQGSSPETFISARRIGERHSRNDLHVFRRALAQHQPAQRPVNNPNAIQIPRSKNQICILRGFKEHRDVIRVVRKVSIQLEDELIPMLERPLETRDVRPPQPILLSSMQDMNR